MANPKATNGGSTRASDREDEAALLRPLIGLLPPLRLRPEPLVDDDDEEYDERRRELDDDE